MGSCCWDFGSPITFCYVVSDRLLSFDECCAWSFAVDYG